MTEIEKQLEYTYKAIPRIVEHRTNTLQVVIPYNKANRKFVEQEFKRKNIGYAYLVNDKKAYKYILVYGLKAELPAFILEQEITRNFKLQELVLPKPKKDIWGRKIKPEAICYIENEKIVRVKDESMQYIYNILNYFNRNSVGYMGMGRRYLDYNYEKATGISEFLPE